MNNYLNNWNPLQPRDELLEQITSIPLQQHSIPQDMPHDHPQPSNPPINSLSKKVVHRDVERQRRQEMSALYTSLRSLVPLEFLKGRRSISDHMNEATNYIKHLEKRIHELKDKRDQLKRLSSSNTSANDVVTEGSSGSDFVTVTRCWQGVEVVVGRRLEDGMLSLTSVLAVLAEGGFSPVSCVSAQVNDRLIHTIQAEVTDHQTESSEATFGALHQKLMNLVRSTS